MRTTRRQFMQQAAAGGASISLASMSAFVGAEPQPTGEETLAEKKLNLLILGGTGFLGPHTVRAALDRGHTMTLFNRGRTNPHLFPNLEKLVGDRDPEKGEGLSALEGREWDAVIDTSGYYPRVVKASTALLKDKVKQYVFISSVSVYPMSAFSEIGVDEDHPVDTIEDETIEEITGESYGPLKALCEQAAQEAFPDGATNIRPGLIVGPGDPTDRFTYWPVRIDQGGEVLAPEPKSLAVQYIDARDLARFIIHAIERHTTGAFNALGPRGPLNMAELLYGCKAVTSTPVEFTWIDSDFLQEQNVGAWMELPLWVPGEEMRGFGQVSNTRAVEAGLTFRPLADTARDTIEWSRTERGADYDFGQRGGLAREKEQRVLKAWRERDETLDG